MKWVTLLKDFKSKVGISQSPSTSSTPSVTGETDPSGRNDSSTSLSGGKHELELDFKRLWEEFRSSSSEEEKETSLYMVVDVFCRLVKQQANIPHLLTMIVEANIFSFVVGRAFVTDIGKLNNIEKTRSFNTMEVLRCFSEVSKDGAIPGSSLLYAVEVLVSGLMDKQSLLDSGILCCLIHILSTLLNTDGSDQVQLAANTGESNLVEKGHDGNVKEVLRLEVVEGSIVHIIKALSSQPSAAQSLIEDDSLQLLFQMVARGSRTVSSRFREDLVLLHTIQLHRHAMQILGLLLINDNGSTAKYIRKHHLIKVLLIAVKDFNPETNDSAYTVGLVELLLECVELSYRPEAGGIRLREDIHNAHGYQFLVQFALILSTLQNNHNLHPVQSKSSSEEVSALDGSHTSSSVGRQDYTGEEEGTSSSHLCPSLSRLLDVLVNLALAGPTELTGVIGVKSSNSIHSKVGGHGRIRTSSSDMSGNKIRAISGSKVKDLEAIQMLQDIFLKADSIQLQAEVLNRMFKIFSCHLENYKLCQQLRTVPLFILNMENFPPSLQEAILKILEYAVTVVNCIPEQELLSLCCLLQQPITSDLKYTILSFFIKLLSFDQQYKKVLREVGFLEVLLDDLKQHKFLSVSEQNNRSPEHLEKKASLSSFKKQMDHKDGIICSSMLSESSSGKFQLFEIEVTISVAWDCMFSLLKKDASNQSSFRLSNGVAVMLPFLASDIHRSGVLWILACLIIEDVTQAYPKDLGTLIEVLKSGMVSSVSGSHYKLEIDGKCDTFGALWRIMRVNNSAQRVFGEVTGFSLLLTSLHSFQSDEGCTDGQSLLDHMKVFTFLLRVVTAAVCGNAANRVRLHAIISSQTFYVLLSESGLLCMDCEKQVVHLLLELAVEIVIPPSNMLSLESWMSSDMVEVGFSNFSLSTALGTTSPDKERVYNAGAVLVLIRSLLLFSPKVQLEVLYFIEKLALAGPFNQENLTSIGCVGLLLEIIHPFISGFSPLLNHALQIVGVLASYRLSSSELRVLVRYILQYRLMNPGLILIDMMERLIRMENMASDLVSMAPYLEMDMSKVGHASVQFSLGERSWPPAAGYSFLCWFQYQNFLKSQGKESNHPSKTGPSRRQSNFRGQLPGGYVLRIFSVGTADYVNTFYAELYLQNNGVLTLATSNSCSLSFPGLELDEGRWHHLAVVHSKPNAVAGFFQASVAYLYVNGKLMHTGKLGYSLSPVGKPLQVTIGTPITQAKVGELSWKLRSCYLFEEVLTPGSIFFIYILGRGYRGVFQDTDIMHFVPNQACAGVNMAILDSLDSELPSNKQRHENAGKQGNRKADGNAIIWDLVRIRNLSLQLSGKRLIFAFDGTSSEAYRESGSLSMLNLVDPMSAAASPLGGIPRFGHLLGDIYICRQRVIGDGIRMVGGIAVILALVEAAETRGLLHMALTLLACALHQTPQNLFDMQACRGYHLLALFLHRRMSLFDMQSLEIFFRIAACEASSSELQKLLETQNITSSAGATRETNYDDPTSSKFPDGLPSVVSLGEKDDFMQKDSSSHNSELENAGVLAKTSSCIVLSNADMVEHVLLDWTLWVTAPVSIQIALLDFFERLVSMHRYRNHNLTVLRRINLVQHLLVTLQRGDVEVPVLEKLVVLLGVILEDGFLGSELEQVVRFVIMTFHPPELTAHHQIIRESMGKHVIVRNMLLEMLIDLQMTINSEELLEQWHKLVSSKLITYYLDEAVHPTTMRWIMTLLGVCLASSPTFSLKFRSSGGYQGLTRMVGSFFDSPEIYYIFFCIIFGKPVYPRLPEVRMLDFHALIPSNGRYEELKFVELLESVIAMAKSTFVRLSMKSMLARQIGNFQEVGEILVAELVEATTDTTGELHGEALMHKTYAARLMGGEATAPAVASSVLRFMVDLAKSCPLFSAACRRAEFLESCVDLYFSCGSAACAVKMVKDLSTRTEENLTNSSGTQSSQYKFSSLPHDEEQSAMTSTNPQSSPQFEAVTSSEDMLGSDLEVDNAEEKVSVSQKEPGKPVMVDGSIVQNFDGENGNQMPTFSSINNELKFPNINVMQDLICPLESFGSSVSTREADISQDLKSKSKGSHASNTCFAVNPRLLLEMDDLGYGGGPCSAGATAVLDFMAEVLADSVAEQIKAVHIESILEAVPSYVDVDSVLVFQGLCLNRLMNFLERRLLRDDKEHEKKLDKSLWSVNLDALCSMIVDRVYMGAFPKPGSVLGALEFFLSMLQLVNKDGRIEEAPNTGKGLLSIARGSRQLDPYIHTLLKNTNRMIMYCFLPSFLITIQEEDLLSFLGLQIEPKRSLCSNYSQQESGIDITSVLQLLVAHKSLIFCPSNLDTDLDCCLSVNLISLLHDKRRSAKSMAMDVIKYLLVHRRAAIEELLVSKPKQGQKLDVLNSGFDNLLTGSSSEFFEWLQSSKHIINEVLEQGPAAMWVQHISGSTEFPGVRVKVMEDPRRRETGRRSRDTPKQDIRLWEQMNERRYALELVRDAMSTELKVIRQDKYGWILHAESEWQTHLQQLVHERGILPIVKSITSNEPKWQLCPTEGPYRMRKKLERCKVKIDTVHNVLNKQFKLDGSKGENGNSLDTSKIDFDSFIRLFSNGSKQSCFDGGEYDDSFSNEINSVREGQISSDRIGCNDNQGSSINEANLYSALELGCKSSASSVPITDNTHTKSSAGSPRQSSMRNDDMKVTEDRLDKELHDNGEYLIRPYLEPLEKVRFRYNCERVVGLDKHDGIFLIGEHCLYVIENFYIDDYGCICEKECEDELSVIDQALGVKKDVNGNTSYQSKSPPQQSAAVKEWVGGRAWAYNGGAWGKEKACYSGSLPHSWCMWRLDSVHEILKRDYQLRPVAIEIFSMDGYNELLIYHKKEREEVFKNLVSMNLPRNRMLDTTISGSSKEDGNEGSRLFKIMAKSFSKRWQNGEISNFQYLMHLNTLAGRGYSDLTQYPVFPWVIADYESETLDLKDQNTFRKLDKPMGCQTAAGEEEFKKRYQSWDDPDVPKFHYGSHYSSAGIILFYLVRLPPFSIENQKLQGGEFDHADRLFNSVRDTWLSASGTTNTSDVKELVPEFFYLPEFLENQFNLDLGEKQSGEKVGDVVLPPWAKGSAREFIRKHREALESDYVSENLHHWIDLIFGYKQRGKAAEDALNVFFHYTYEGSVNIDSISDPSMKASILAQINHFGQTPRQLFLKPHVKRRSDKKLPPHPLRHCNHLVPHEIRKTSCPITQIVIFHEKILLAGPNNLLKPKTYNKYVSWGFPDRSLRFISYDQEKLLSTHESLHEGNQIQCAGITHDGQILVTGAEDSVISVWRIRKDGPRGMRRLHLKRTLCAHTTKVTYLHVSQPYMMIVSGSDDCTVILWDLSSLIFVRQLAEFPTPVSAIYMNDLTGEIVIAAGILLSIWSINGDCLAVINSSQLPSDFVLAVTSSTFSDWLDTNWYVTGHQSGAVKVWQMVHCSNEAGGQRKPTIKVTGGLRLNGKVPEYRLVLHKVLKFHKHPVSALHLTSDRKQLLSGDASGHLLSWSLPDESS
ncbi:BEACH domain [Macleaya cordata]|uniref:BEACH domain n=1 Tax=Macleaya cordata TaxID=56857 RepID=A0A200PZ23_MACCD|nr:BEACH domain [Macleaya cordata]